jgi:hypothetical protein
VVSRGSASASHPRASAATRSHRHPG